MVFLDVLDTANVIEDAMRSLSYFLCEIIFSLVMWIYNVFDRLCNSRILDSTALQTISERVGILLGIIMLFIVVFSVIQMVLEPDKLTDKEKGIGNILKKVILVIVMLGASSFAFELMYGIQKKVIDSNVIQRFLLPYEITDKDNFGGVLSYNLFNTVYHINGDVLKSTSFENLDDNTTRCNEALIKLETKLKGGVNDPFEELHHCSTIKTTDKKFYIISFNWLLAPIIGGGVLYFIFSYCISIGIRTIQLAFLEIMAPMAIISYLSPKKDSMFSKWTKLYFATYIDVFLRIMIINLIAFLIMTILESSDKWVFWNSVGGKTGTFADKAILILMVFALLTFAKKAPDLIKDLFPSGASKLGFGVTSPKKMFDSMLGGNLIKGGLTRTAGLGIGAVTGGLGNAIRGSINDKENRLRGFFNGLAGGALAGAKAGAGAKGVWKSFGASNKAALDQSQRIAEWRANGGTSPWSRWATGVQQRLGFQTSAGADDKKINALENFSKIQDQIEANADNNKVIKLLKKRFETIQQAGKSETETADEFNLRVRAAEADWKETRKKMISASMTSGATANTTFDGYELDANGNLLIDSSGNLVSSSNCKIGDSGRVVNSLVDQANRIMNEDKTGAFDSPEYNKTPTDFDSFDKNTVRAKNDITITKSTKEYASNQADAKYNPKSGK